MKVLLINIDKKYPNLALEKIALFHRDDEVIWDMPLYTSQCDKMYVSCIFSWNKHLCKQWEGVAEIGGSGYDIIKKLPENIENIKPHINWGFTTRGCIRKCGFCIVPKKEGQIRPVGDLYDLWNGEDRDIILLDNNILALPEHFKLICEQARKEKLRLDFNQGLDVRLLTEDICKELKSIPHEYYRFAFDNPQMENKVGKAIELLQENGINRCRWYVLVGFNTTIEQDLQRLNFLRDRNQNAYVQRYNKHKDRKYIPLARWANQPHIFQAMTWEQFITRPENRNYNNERNRQTKDLFRSK